MLIYKSCDKPRKKYTEFNHKYFTPKFKLKKLHHIQKELHAELKILHQIRNILHQTDGSFVLPYNLQ